MRNIEIRNFGWKKDKRDERDYLYKTIKPSEISVPEKVDLRPLCSYVEDQDGIGSCVANALAGNVELLHNKLGQDYENISRLYLYYNARVIEGTVNEDSGLTIRDGIKALADTGYCEESLWEYNVSQFTVKPPEICYEQGKTHKIISYYSIRTLNEMLICLADGYPFVFGMGLWESFNSYKTKVEGIVKMPDSGFIGWIKHLLWMGEKSIGAHAVMAVGYDKKKQQFLCRNSWGIGWGQQGYFVIPFKYLEILANDFWTIRK